ncbi:hypothetical protein H5410_056685 [Solanum commersonii]|uniref:Uncharacterized protein n=1 Tax=Solanum commersonii TaxID=4109 RepID=A0A9J5WMY7_SOLCO|nr:hypothetical protein H5410_056685 [Solanum commersonii]
MEPIGLDGKIDPFSRSNEPRSDYRAIWSRRVNHPIVKVKRLTKRVKTPFCQFSCAIVHESFGDPAFRRNFCKNLLWTSIKTLAMDLVGLYGKTSSFSMAIDPRSG